LLVLTGQGAAIDTTTAAGKLVFSIFAALAEFERELIRERTIAGLAAARARGRHGGRKPKMTPAKLRLAQAAMGKEAPSSRTRVRNLASAARRSTGTSPLPGSYGPKERKSFQKPPRNLRTRRAGETCFLDGFIDYGSLDNA
jgi:hypothetical protein